MRIGVITGGVLSNIVEADAAWSAANSGIDLALHPIANIGDTWNGTVFTKPSGSLAMVKTDRLALMDATYESLEHAPIAYMATTFQADDYSQDLIAKTLVALGGATPADLGWWDVSNTRVFMTNAQLQGLGQAIFARNQPLYINKQTKKAAIRAALTVAAVEAIVW